MTIQKKFGIAVVTALPENMHCSGDRDQGGWTARVRHQREIKYYVEGRTAACRTAHRMFLKEAKKNKFTFFEMARGSRRPSGWS